MNAQGTGLNPRPIAFGGLVSAALAAVTMLIIGAVTGLELWLSMIMAFQMAVLFAIVGGWAVASFAFDEDESDSKRTSAQDAKSVDESRNAAPSTGPAARSKAA